MTVLAASVDVGALIARPMAMAMVRPVAQGRVTTTRDAVGGDVDAFIVAMYDEHGRGLVRMVRLFLDDRNAAEDLVQEAFIRLARSAHKINDPQKAAAYLRSIVLNLARDHNRRGLVSLRHRVPSSDQEASIEDSLELTEDIAAVIDALRELAPRQRDCLVLRYYDELGIDEIAETLGLSRNSVKTHLTRGLRALEGRLADVAVAGRESVGIEP
ncbi:MAG TPA: sigma-70 family RNA polymerase sigma factor [Acidimicrobiales bacterium]|nr:sigma-70 family RNA polymerase sigma factor [Acidimicrobiales bacterium]